MRRATIDKRIRAEDAREGPLGLYLMDTYRKHRVSLQRDIAAMHRAQWRSRRGGLKSPARPLAAGE